MTRWEYASITWSYSTSQEEGKKSTWKQVFHVYWPDGTTDVRLCWTSEDTDEETTTPNRIQNELGAEGWELVSANALDTVILSNSEGWSNVGTPVKWTWIFKRPIAD